MEKKLIIVTGYFGSPIVETAVSLAEEKAFAYLSLDEEISRRDGRSISRLCMMAGEHGYRNAEYELLNEIAQKPGGFCHEQAGIVIACGDGVLYDDMSRDIALKSELIIAGGNMSIEALWQGALSQPDSCHAFMKFGSEDEKRLAFEKYIERQRKLFSEV